MKIRSILLWVILFFSVSCDKVLLGDKEKIISLEENLSAPAYLNDGWEVSSLSDEGVNAELIKTFVSQLQENNHNINSLIIVKNNKLVLESYFGGWHRERLQSLRSASKSIASCLIGIAIDKTYIKSTQEKVFDFFPEYNDLRTDQKDKIELKHILSMTAGLAWDQTSFPDEDPRNDEDQLGKSEDGFRYTLQKKVVYAPGVTFNYSSGNSDLLTGIIHHTTGMHADKFAEEHLFKPLGINNYGWRKNNNGYPNAGFGLHMRPRDMAKIGQLFLDGGEWKGQQIISSEWVKESTEEFNGHLLNNNQGYGYQWWTRNWTVKGRIIKTFQAQGNGGQIICIIPEFNIVVILTGTNYGFDKGRLPYSYLENRIFPAFF